MAGTAVGRLLEMQPLEPDAARRPPGTDRTRGPRRARRRPRRRRYGAGVADSVGALRLRPGGQTAARRARHVAIRRADAHAPTRADEGGRPPDGCGHRARHRRERRGRRGAGRVRVEPAPPRRSGVHRHRRQSQSPAGGTADLRPLRQPDAAPRTSRAARARRPRQPRGDRRRPELPEVPARGRPADRTRRGSGAAPGAHVPERDAQRPPQSRGRRPRRGSGGRPRPVAARRGTPRVDAALAATGAPARPGDGGGRTGGGRGVGAAAAGGGGNRGNSRRNPEHVGAVGGGDAPPEKEDRRSTVRLNFGLPDPSGGHYLRGSMALALIQIASDPQRKPPWLKVKAPGGATYVALKHMRRDLKLHTVCEEAHCPNIGECWEHKAATFMILGDVCSRNCAYCAVAHGTPGPLDREEPVRLAEAVAQMQLRHVVITSVDRDDLANGGAEVFAQCITEIRRRLPDTSIEVLIPDFKGNAQALRLVIDAGPDILNHNLETIERLYRIARPGGRYARALELFRRARAIAPQLRTKSGIICGLGEEWDELLIAMRDLRAQA